MAAAGLALIVYGTFFLDSATPWPSAWALVPTVGAALIIGAGCRTEDTVVGRLLSLRPMTWLGGISYSVYLWHWPLLVLAEVQWPEIGLPAKLGIGVRSEEHTSELQSLMRISYAVFGLTTNTQLRPVRIHPPPL